MEAAILHRPGGEGGRRPPPVPSPVPSIISIMGLPDSRSTFVEEAQEG